MKTNDFLFWSSILVVLCLICATLYLIDFSVGPAATDLSDSPHFATVDATVRVIDSANSQILVQACSFTSVRLAKALVDARNRGVYVSVILGKDQQEARQYSVARDPDKGQNLHLRGSPEQEFPR